MAILVDPAIWPWRERLWCHMVSDRHLEELHEFADTLGVPPRGFQGDHYDIPLELRARAIDLGAVPVTSKEIVLALYAAGLREPRARSVLSPASPSMSVTVTVVDDDEGQHPRVRSL